MLQFIFADENSLFLIAISIVFILGLLEGLGLLIGLSLSTLFDNLSPFDVDFDISGDASSGGLTQILGWLCLNRLPLMIWLVLFLTTFSICGYTINFTLASSFSYVLPSAIASSVALVPTVLLTNKLGKRLALIMPKNESSAITVDTFAGRVAQITLGTARVGSPAEASFIDHFQQKHYVMVEPIDETMTFNQGDKIVLVEKGPNSWTATSFD